MTDPLVGSSPALDRLRKLIANWRERARLNAKPPTVDPSKWAWKNIGIAQQQCAEELERLVRELVPVPPQPQPEAFERNSVGDLIAWILIETVRGKACNEGIALTHEAKDRFVRAYFEPGNSRSALPLKLHSPVPSVPVPPQSQEEFGCENDLPWELCRTCKAKQQAANRAKDGDK